MRCKRIGAGAALAAGALAVTGLAFAPAALAVTPQTATISADCGTFGSGEATLTATQNGTAATVTVKSSAITAPIALGADSITSSLTLVKSGGGTVAFTGTENPAMAAGAPVEVGPLSGTVASGDSLEAFGGSLKMTVFGITITCTATGPQSPGPFVFD
ncbi:MULTISPECIES: hypothetical protein [Streptomyces]|uniref:Autotransporter-associated beta strand repeat-containing protein n=1 Tax=Streptomyces koelreuteriae TaxID=2838015 RepID=A0ABX8FXA5_9ACTN|nr:MULTISPECIES: hypothetical protein [Streptomyces]QWB25698.1 hypothetical protein KJK29_25780 [Streptomyces koelreuteriae]UUA08753.1 hypothetical protein NNW98_25935 [Streptomyces koelreuteriae]UUA16358.1 hypothetical protein NNW99_25820 [Streptomyces sp. CRCS-T-1]